MKVIRWFNIALIAIIINFAALAAEEKSTKAVEAPKLTVFIVIDQLSFNSLRSLRPYLKGGLGNLLDNGTSYMSAFFPHAAPGTAIGHTALSTGAYAKDHGIVNNEWFEQGKEKKTKADDDSSESAAVFKKDGISTYAIKDKKGKSPKNILVDNLSDQIVLAHSPISKYSILSLSLKSRAAIALAGHMGALAGEAGAKAVWFDEKDAFFTSSKAYFDKLPDWLVKFNTDQKIDQVKSFKWNPLFDKSAEQYKFPEIDNYKYSTLGHSIIGKYIGIDRKTKEPYALFLATPMANKNLVNLAELALENTIKENLEKKNNNKILMWLSLSSLDKIGHLYGPQTLEYIDMIYQMDHQLQEFMDFVYSKFDKKDVLFILTADHGMQPIYEVTKDQGMPMAKRLNEQEIFAAMNDLVKKKYDIDKFVFKFKAPFFYYDLNKFNKLDPETQEKINKDLKDYLLSQTGIGRVWSEKELKSAIFEEGDPGWYFKNQTFPGRSGQLIYEIRPYNFMDNLPSGTTHLSPQNYDRQVPLIFYQSSRFQKQTIFKNVSMLSVPVSLSYILGVPRPSLATSEPLPGLSLK